MTADPPSDRRPPVAPGSAASPPGPGTTGDPPRVLHVVTRSEWGGAQRIVTTLADRTDAETVVACGPGGRLLDELAARDVPVRVLDRLRSPPAPVGDPATLLGLVSLVRRGGFDLVHCHSTKAGALGRVAARAAGVPAVFTVHGWGFYNEDYGRLRPLVRGGERLLARVTDRVVCVSEHDRRRGREAGILDDGEGLVVHNGVDPAGTTRSEGRDRLDREFGIGPGEPVVGTVGRLAPQKDPLALLRTAERLADRDAPPGTGRSPAGDDGTRTEGGGSRAEGGGSPGDGGGSRAEGGSSPGDGGGSRTGSADRPVHTVLVGEGPLRAECERFVADRGLAGVHVAGFREEVRELVAGFDVFALPSRFEGLPLSVLEAMHAGVPVVANAVGGVPEAVEDGETGYVVDPGDHDAFLDRVAELLADGPQRDRMGDRARERALERFTADRMVDDYDRVYGRILDG